ncbi:MAG: hypothetical protein Q4A35_04470 [Candidatus Gracilibacteria bacterium]|nr:hypothetical protein [Candidatus Gracilibacteria bacterium]
MFIKSLSLSCSKDFILSESFSDQLEEIFLEFPDLEYEIQETRILVWNEKFLNNENISFGDYLEIGKKLKTFGLKNQIFNDENYKNFFKIEKLELAEPLSRGQMPSTETLDAMIAKVDKNDPKLLEVLAKIEKIRKK